MIDLHALLDQPLSPEYRAQAQKAHAYYAKITRAFTPEFFDEFWQAHMALTEQERDNSFREGFQAGVLFLTRAILTAPGMISP